MALSQLGYTQYRLGEYLDAQESLRTALARYDEGGLPDHHERAQTLLNLSLLQRAQARFAESIESGTLALEMWHRLYPPTHFYVGNGAQILAANLEQAGRLGEAEQRAREALACFTAALPESHPYRLEAQATLASIQIKRGALHEARALMEENLAARQAVWGVDGLVVADDYAALAEVYAALGDPERSLEWIERERDILEEGLGPHHPRTVTALVRAGRLQLGLGRVEQARAIAALVDQEEVFAAPTLGPLRRTQARVLLGRVALTGGDLEAALEQFDRARRAQDALDGAHPVSVEVAYQRGLVLARMGRTEDAAYELEHALSLAEAQRHRVFGDEQARALFASRLSIDLISQELTHTHAALGNAAAALSAAERGRNRALMDLLLRSEEVLLAGERSGRLRGLRQAEEEARVAEVVAAQALRSGRARPGTG
ncbi:MAG: tetratricopeptide repeat protein, partial [Planctomycetota bacterium]|nr:tetratricopeptide repeat protein [Planctomycetota bacterium]